MDISSGSIFVGWKNLGEEFDIIYEGVRIPTKNKGKKSKVILTDKDCSRSCIAIFKLTITGNTACIDWLRSTKEYSGTFVLKMLIQLCKYIKVKRIHLVDAALVSCGPDESIYLSRFKMLTEGQTYYGKHGGFEADVENVDKWKADCARLVKQFQEVKLADYIANLQDVINLVSKYDTILTQTVDIISPADMEPGVLPDKSIIEKYKTIIEKCSASNREYLYQYMIDIVPGKPSGLQLQPIVRSTDYLELESTLYSGSQIYSFSAEDGTKVCREYVIPAVTISAMVGDCQYVLLL